MLIRFLYVFSWKQYKDSIFIVETDKSSSSSSSTYLGCGDSSIRREPMPPSPQVLPPASAEGCQGAPGPEEKCNLSSQFWVSPQGLLPTWNTSPGMHSGDILTRCLNHLFWLHSMQRSSISILSPCQISELLSLSLKGRKLISAIHSLILAITTHSSWP